MDSQSVSVWGPASSNARSAALSRERSSKVPMRRVARATSGKRLQEDGDFPPRSDQKRDQRDHFALAGVQVVPCVSEVVPNLVIGLLNCFTALFHAPQPAVGGSEAEKHGRQDCGAHTFSTEIRSESMPTFARR